MASLGPHQPSETKTIELSVERERRFLTIQRREKGLKATSWILVPAQRGGSEAIPSTDSNLEPYRGYIDLAMNTHQAA